MSQADYYVFHLGKNEYRLKINEMEAKNNVDLVSF